MSNVYQMVRYWEPEEKRFGTVAAKILNFIRRSVTSKESREDDYWESKGHRHGFFWAYDTLDDMARKIGISRRALCKHIKILEDENYLIIDRYCNSMGIKQHFYRINPELDLFKKQAPQEQKTACIMHTVHFPSSILKIKNSNPPVTTPSNPNSYGLSTPIEGDDKRILAIPYFEEKFKRKIAKTERNKFFQNLAENPETTYDDLVIAIEQLYADPLMRISTTSLNRVFRIENVVKDFEQGKAELKAIGKRLKNNFTGTFPLVIWSQEIMRSKFARRAKFASQEDILNYGAMAGFETTFEDMYYKCYG